MSNQENQTERAIASYLLEYLKNNDEVCADGNANGWTWIRYEAGDWQAVRFSRSDDTLKSYVVGDVLDEATVMDWLVSKPATIIPQRQAYLWGPSENTVWELADEQDVFEDYERCFWCGDSERNQTIKSYQTTENGECSLCPECRDSWASAGEIQWEQGCIQQ
jgi:hypothetical protein